MLRIIIFISIVFLFSDLKISKTNYLEKIKISNLELKKENVVYKFYKLENYKELIKSVDKGIKKEKDKEFLVFLDKDLLPIMKNN